MPSTSPKQQKLMERAAHTPSGYDEIPQVVGKEFVDSDKGDSETHLRHELDYAKAIAAGTLSSPQRYENVWLFDIRITGTGYAHRDALDEHVYRPPENYLSDDFVQRCNGLTVIYEHPNPDPEKSKGVLLDSEEFSNRVIGSIFLPYVKGDEVWGIAKIYDDAAAEAMQTTHISTSPGVNFANKAGVQKVSLTNDEVVMVEGTPSLLDHVAICPLGVWDKGGAPSGVNIGDSQMAEEDKIEDKTKADAAKMDEAPAWAKGIADSVAALSARMDSMDKAKADAEEAIKAKVDAEEAEKATADAESVKSAEFADMQKQLSELKRQMPRDLTDDERNEIAQAQARADSVFAGIGKKLPQAMLGEAAADYKRRLAAILQPFSKAWKDEDLKSLPVIAFGNAEGAIYADAQAAATAQSHAPVNGLREIKSETSAGHKVTTYVGDPRAWLDQFSPPVRFRASGFSNSNRGVN